MQPTSTLSLLGLCLFSVLVPRAHALFAPGADQFANAPVVTTQNDQSQGTYMLNATSETGEPKHRPDFMDGALRSVWWKWTAPESGFCHVDSLTPDYMDNAVRDTVLTVYTGSAIDGLTRVASNNDHTSERFAANHRQSKVVFYAIAGVTYSIAIDGAYEGTVSANYTQSTLRIRQMPPKAVTRRALWMQHPYATTTHGILTMTTTATGSYSGVLQMGALKYPFTGIFDRDGTTVRSIVPAAVVGAPPRAPITIRIDGAGVGEFSLEMDTHVTGGAFPRQLVFSRTVLNPLTGIYNLGAQPTQNYNDPRGWSQATVSTTGAVTFACAMPDGLRVTASTFLHETGSPTSFIMPVHAMLHANLGFLRFPAMATLDSSAAADHEITADCWYLRPQNVRSTFYPYGYNNSFYLKGRKFIKPLLNARVMDFLGSSGVGGLYVRSETGELDNDVFEGLSLTTANKFVFATPLPRKVSLAVNTLTGLVTGSMTTTDVIAGVSRARARSLQGLIFRDGAGTYLRGHATGTTRNLYLDVKAPQL